MYISSYNEIQAIQDIKNYLKRSAEEFEAKQLLKKTKFVASTFVTSTPLSNVTYATELTNDISYVKQIKNPSSNTNEVSKIIDREIEFLYVQKSSTKDDKFQKIIEELFPYKLINKEMTIESEICDPVLYVDQQTSIQSPLSTDIISLAWSIAVLSPDNNLESGAKESTISSDLTNDVSSSDLTPEINQKISEPKKRSCKNPEYRKKKSEARKRNGEDPEYRKKLSEAMKLTWQDPEYKKKRSEAMKLTWEDPEYRKKLSEAMKRRWEDPEYRKKMSQATKRRWENPEYRKKMSKAKGNTQKTI